MHSSVLNPNRRYQRRAFTLVEMLVVIAIMSVLMTAGAIGLGGMGGKGVSSGVASAESLFDEARSIAVGQRVRTRVLIAKSLTGNPAENLRRMAVVAYIEKRDANGNVTSANWELSSRGIVLPDQVFYSQEFSSEDQAGGSGTIKDMTLQGVKAAYAGSYFYYEFNAEGICTTPGASLVIGTGSRSLQNPTDQPRVTSAGKRDFGGFVIWRNGTTSLFRSPSQISSSIQSLDTGDQF